jgi:hypothetical protein
LVDPGWGGWLRTLLPAMYHRSAGGAAAVVLALLLVLSGRPSDGADL